MIPVQQNGPQMCTFALCHDGEVRGFAPAPAGTEWPSDIEAIDVTGMNPVPQVGWTVVDGKLSAPVPIEVPAPTQWYVSMSTVRERATAAGRWDELAAALDALPSAKRWQLSTLREGIANDDPDALALLQVVGLDAAVILAPLGAT